MIMAYFNEDNVTEQMCIAVAKEQSHKFHSSAKIY